MGVFGPRNPLFQEMGIRGSVWGWGNPKPGRFSPLGEVQFEDWPDQTLLRSGPKRFLEGVFYRMFSSSSSSSSSSNATPIPT